VYYSWGRVTEGNKCIKVPGSGRRLPADVLVAQAYRRYHTFPAYGGPSDTSGIIFATKDGREVISYPKQHRTDGQTKNANGGRYKGRVRHVSVTT
jgi:hypothetical protein